MQTGAAAATVTSVGTVAISIQSLNYNGTTYDVSFGAPGIGPGAPRNVQLAAKILF